MKKGALMFNLIKEKIDMLIITIQLNVSVIIIHISYWLNLWFFKFKNKKR